MKKKKKHGGDGERVGEGLVFLFYKTILSKKPAVSGIQIMLVTGFYKNSFFFFGFTKIGT